MEFGLKCHLLTVDLGDQGQTLECSKYVYVKNDCWMGGLKTGCDGVGTRSDTNSEKQEENWEGQKPIVKVYGNGK